MHAVVEIGRRRRLAVPALLLAALSQLAAAQPGQVRPAWVEPLGAQLDSAQREHDLSGVVLVAQGDQVLLRRAFGWADRGLEVRMRPSHRFNLASMNKMFTALAVLRLVQQGRLTLDEPIARWLPDYANREVAGQVTVRQLLAHTSGLGNYWDALLQRPPASVCTTSDVVALFVDDPLASAPGERFAYSNAGYVLLGLLIETVTGETYDAHLQRTVFAPLGMTHTGAAPLDHVVRGRVTGHARSPDTPGLWLRNDFIGVYCGSAAGGGWSTADDLLKFGRALAGGELLDREHMALYSTGVQPYRGARYALGISEETIAGQRVIGHSGGHVGIANELLVVPERKLVAVILSNGDVDAFWNVRHRLTRAWFGSGADGDSYWRTLDVIGRTVAAGFDAGVQAAADAGGGEALRESVIDVSAGKWLHRGDAARALALFELNSRLFPASDDALLRLADAARVFGRRDLAMARYNHYLARVPDDADAAAHLQALVAEDGGKPE